MILCLQYAFVVNTIQVNVTILLVRQKYGVRELVISLPSTSWWSDLAVIIALLVDFEEFFQTLKTVSAVNFCMSVRVIKHLSNI